MNLSYTSAVILQAVAAGAEYGFTIIELTGLPSGTVYPALRRLEDARYVRAQWESEGKAHKEGRPARRYYEITSAGSRALAEALKRYRLLARTPLPNPEEEKGNA